jgi:Protein of unknown function (DUF4240)
VDAGRFWEIIETARASASRDRPFHEALTDHLATLTEQDILEYYERFEKMHDALYRHDLWAAAYSSEAAVQTTASSTSGPDSSRRDTTGTTRRRRPRTAWPAIPP